MFPNDKFEVPTKKIKPNATSGSLPLHPGRKNDQHISFKTGGYPLQLFLEKPSLQFICPICAEVLKEPFECTNGHTSCECCMMKFVANQEYSCPKCVSPIPITQLKKNTVLQSQIENLKTRCWKNMPNYNKSKKPNSPCSNLVCAWQGKLCDLESHLRNECMLSLACCPNLRCEFKSVRHDLVTNHQSSCENQIIKCTIKGCEESYPLRDGAKHLLICKYNVSACPNKCGLNSFKTTDDVKNHTERECLLQLVPCPLFQLSSPSATNSVAICGCTGTGVILRKNLSNHLANMNILPNVMMSCLTEIVKLKDQVFCLQTENKRLRSNRN